MIADILSKVELPSVWESVSVVTGIVYLVLAVRRSLWCWFFAFVSSAIAAVIWYRQNVYMQTWLSVFYVGMAVYGYLEWRRGRNAEGEVRVRRWPWFMHAVAIAGVLLVAAINGRHMSENTEAAAPYLDAFTTWGAVLTTWMVARRLVENWLYWVVVDAATAWLSFRQDLNFFGILYVAYIGMVIHGYFVWMRDSRQKSTLPES